MNLDGWTEVPAAELDALGGSPMNPNRKWRRDYIRMITPRIHRMHAVGFGRWRRHRYLTRRMDES